MPLTGTSPNLIDAGAKERVEAPALSGLNAVLVPPTIPVQPEIDRIAKSKRTRVAKGIDFFPKEHTCIAHFHARSNQLLLPNLSIAPIVVCGTRRDYCP